MIYIETGSTDVYYNFGLEYYFTAEKKLPEPVFLFWRTTPTLMIGKYQNTLEEINKKYVDAHNIHIVRRLSGGGTIYTDPGGWQFSFITQGDSDSIQFQQYLTPVLDALQGMGIPAEFNGRNDLTVEGKSSLEMHNISWRVLRCTTAPFSLTPTSNRWWPAPRWMSIRFSPRASSPSTTG